MAKSTPEGKVKEKLIKYLKSLGDKCFYYMPVSNGMGQMGIPDIMVIIQRIPFAFECKATPKQSPTALQCKQLERIHKAGGIAWVVDNESIDLALDVLSNKLQFENQFELKDVELLSQIEVVQPLYRWRDKL